MVLEVVYSVGAEKFKEAIRNRQLEKNFKALSDEHVPESERSYNRKYNSLKVTGGKIHELNQIEFTKLIRKFSKDF